MTKQPPCFNEINEIIRSLALKHGEDLTKLRTPSWRLRDIEWHWVDKRLDQQSSFDQEIFLMSEAINLYKNANAKGDLLAALKGIMMAQLAAQNLSGFLDSMKDDMRTVMRDSELFQWPEFPDNYEVPEEYKYKGL